MREVARGDLSLESLNLFDKLTSLIHFIILNLQLLSEVIRMNNLAVLTCMKNDSFLYFSRVISFNFMTNGTSLSFYSNK